MARWEVELESGAGRSTEGEGLLLAAGVPSAEAGRREECCLRRRGGHWGPAAVPGAAARGDCPAERAGRPPAEAGYHPGAPVRSPLQFARSGSLLPEDPRRDRLPGRRSQAGRESRRPGETRQKESMPQGRRRGEKITSRVCKRATLVSANDEDRDARYPVGWILRCSANQSNSGTGRLARSLRASPAAETRRGAGICCSGQGKNHLRFRWGKSLMKPLRKSVRALE